MEKIVNFKTGGFQFSWFEPTTLKGQLVSLAENLWNVLIPWFAAYFGGRYNNFWLMLVALFFLLFRLRLRVKGAD